MFDEYVSLGLNCEVAFQLDRVALERRKHFFDWKITPHAALRSLLENRFAGVAATVAPGEHDGMTMDARYGFQFHNQPVHQEREKCAYLANRFLSPDGRRCYILKPESGAAERDIQALCYQLDRFDRDYKLVVLRRPNGPNLAGETVHMLDFFAPVHAANEGDVAGYNRLFDRYPLYLASHWTCGTGRSADEHSSPKPLFERSQARGVA